MRRILITILLATSFAAGASAQVGGGVFPTLVVESIGVDSSDVDVDELVTALGIAVGDEIDQLELADAVARLRASDLYDEVEVYVRPGSLRGRIALEFEIVPHPQTSTPLEIRLGSGVSDVDGWYAIPLEMQFQDVLDRQDEIALRWVLGYRRSGFEAAYLQRGLAGGRGWWGMRAASLNLTRVYYYDGLEIGHDVHRQRLSFLAGRELGRSWDLRFEVGRETSDPRDGARIHEHNDARNVDAGDEVALADLPADIAGAVDRRTVTFAEAALVFSTLADRDLAHTPVSGMRARVFWRSTLDAGSSYGLGGADLRLYRQGLGGVFAARARGLITEDAAPFYERLYLGGFYTVRGVPSNSLTRPEGGNWLWNGSLEYRAPLTGDREHPGLSALLFADVGLSDGYTAPRDTPVAAGAGWGLRWHFLGMLLGFDVGHPLSGSPRNEAIHVNATMWWTF